MLGYTPPACLGDQLERRALRVAHHAEMTTVKCGDSALAVSFRKCHKAGIGSPQSHVDVALDEVCDSAEVVCCERLHRDLAVCDSPHEDGFRGCAQLSSDQVGSLGNDQWRRHQRTGLSLKQQPASVVVSIHLVGGSQQDAGIDDQHESVASEALFEHPVGFDR